jgi:holo-ACP synthase
VVAIIRHRGGSVIDVGAVAPELSVDSPAMLDTGTAVGLEQMLAARERRAARQAAALTRFDQPLVSITVVTPGPVKDGTLPRRVLSEALRAMDVLCRIRKWPVLSREVLWLDTGPEALYAVEVASWRLKSAAVKLEDRHPLGRLWDLDVIAPGQRVLSRKQLGLPARACLVCERPAFECGRSRRHPFIELLNTIDMIVNEHDRRMRG